MLFMAEFCKHADKREVFKAALDPHLAYLAEEKERVLLSATKYDTETKAVLGFVWIIDAADREEAEAICQRDPFWTAGLRTSFHLCSLTKADPDRSAWI
jgi:uncharacterized protein YciI